MRHLDLFSGIGGFALAARIVGGIQTIAFCEIEEYPARVLKKNFPEIPIHNDIKSLSGCEYGPVDIITGGFPCQPYSVAGLRRGNEDDRALWPEMLRVIRTARPSWIIGENVTGIVNLALDGVLDDLEAEGYSCGTFIIPACAVNAPHRRDRVWIIANSERDEQSREESCNGSDRRMGGGFEPVSWDRDWEDALRYFRGMDDGLSYGVDRTDGLRNAIVPQVAAEIFRVIKEIYA